MHYPSDVLARRRARLLPRVRGPGLGARRPRSASSTSRSTPTSAPRRAAARRQRRRPPRTLAPATPPPARVKIGIVGLPNAGKSTLFNALTRAGAETAAYAFTTIDPNVAIVAGPRRAARAGRRDARLQRGRPRDDRVPRHRRPRARRLAGRGARQPVPRRDPRDRRDLPRRPLPHERAACRTRRAASTRGDDIELIETELLAADLEQAERRLERVTKQARSRRQGGDRRARLARAGGRGARRRPTRCATCPCPSGRRRRPAACPR